MNQIARLLSAAFSLLAFFVQFLMWCSICPGGFWNKCNGTGWCGFYVLACLTSGVASFYYTERLTEGDDREHG